MSAFANRFLLVLLLTISVCPGRAFPGEGSKIRIREIVPGMSGGFVTVSAQFQNLFSNRIIGTIQSGLPSVIQVEVNLKDDRDRRVARRRISQTIFFDIWEERYTVRRPDSVAVFAKIDDVKRAAGMLENEVLLSADQLPQSENYSIQIRVGIIPISSSQAEKVTDWLLDPNQTEEYLASDNRSSGFELNLNRLVSFFVSSRKKSNYASEWFFSEKFTIGDLGQ